MRGGDRVYKHMGLTFYAQTRQSLRTRAQQQNQSGKEQCQIVNCDRESFRAEYVGNVPVVHETSYRVGQKSVSYSVSQSSRE